MTMPLQEQITAIKRWYWKHCASELRAARHYLDRSNRHYAKLIDEAKKRGDLKEAESIEAEWSDDVDGDRSDYDSALSHYFTKLATKYRVPTPEYHDEKYWTQSRYDGTWHLTIAGIDEIERRVDEKRGRSATLFSARMTPLVGVLGAVTGLVAVILSHC